MFPVQNRGILLVSLVIGELGGIIGEKQCGKNLDLSVIIPNL